MLYDVDDRLYYHQPRHDPDDPSTTAMTTTGPAPSRSTTPPTSPPPSTGNSPSFTPSPVFSSGSGSTSNRISTTMVPVTTVTQQSTTYTSFAQSLVTPASPQAASATSPLFSTSTVGTRYICAGQGVDSAAAGILASIILPSVVGLILWVRERWQMDTNNALC